MQNGPAQNNIHYINGLQILMHSCAPHFIDSNFIYWRVAQSMKIYHNYYYYYYFVFCMNKPAKQLVSNAVKLMQDSKKYNIN